MTEGFIIAPTTKEEKPYFDDDSCINFKYGAILSNRFLQIKHFIDKVEIFCFNFFPNSLLDDNFNFFENNLPRQLSHRGYFIIILLAIADTSLMFVMI
jgi:hypothetical protein